MPQYSISLLGQEVNFKTDADDARIHKARALLEERFEQLSRSGRNLSKEKLLLFLALGLADDFLQSDTKLRDYEARAKELLARLERV